MASASVVTRADRLSFILDRNPAPKLFVMEFFQVWLVHQQNYGVAAMNALALLTQQQGRQANQNGKAFEEQIAQRLKSKGAIFQIDAAPERTRSTVFIYQYRGDFTSIYAGYQYGLISMSGIQSSILMG